MEYAHIGWCKEGVHDKVWGLILLSEDISEFRYNYPCKYLSFWGRRGAKLQTKLIDGITTYQAEDLFDKKLRKGYKSIRKSELDTVYPNFEKDLEKTAIWATLMM